ncbi:MAG: zinc ribbon domain-containing protein [bacterium]|nr:zinc ribbon domain-containing protein [bacterium]
MPTYDYVCRACNHAFEIFQSMTEGVKRKCPECGKLRLERLIGTGGAILFKGGGFYETDYRSKSYTEGKDADKKQADSSQKKTASDKKAAPDKKDKKKKAD